VSAPWNGLRLFPWEEEAARRLDELPAHGDAAVALVGPEGGFTQEEVALARAHGFVPLTLGPRVLRAETAAIVIVAQCHRRWGGAGAWWRVAPAPGAPPPPRRWRHSASST